MVDAIAHVTVGVADLQLVFDLWVDRFGLETVAQRQGPDPDLARLWGISAEQITDQVLLRTPGAETGWLHFVQFANPDAPVRAGAAPVDLGPKNLDVNCTDMPARYASLEAAGYGFRSAISEYHVGDIHAREVQMPGHDETNIVLIEMLSDGFAMQYPAAGYCALTSFVVIVPDTKIEANFYADLFGLDELMHHRISGPGIEEVVGLPGGSVLDMRLMGREQNFFGRVELIKYEGLQGQDRFRMARPPALGALHSAFALNSLDGFIERAAKMDVEMTAYENMETIFCVGTMYSVCSPAGLRIEVFQRP
jgi:catechol 2,3-dioxygenase-like lactoylglutathione lyase family enzyme